MSDITFIGGRAVKCLSCLNVYTTHNTHLPSGWCNWCQRNTQHESWVFLSGDVNRRACAEPQPGDHGRLIAPPRCSLALDHESDHVDHITRQSWPRSGS